MRAFAARALAPRAIDRGHRARLKRASSRVEASAGRRGARSFADARAAVGCDASPRARPAASRARRERPSTRRRATASSEDPAARDGEDARPELEDTIAPLSDALYPRALDAVPTFFGRLNPLTAVLLFYTGAMLRESREAPIIGAQWLLLVVLPTFGALYALRRWWYESKTAPRHEGEHRPFAFKRACRSAWLDFHVGYMLLVPAGAYGGEGSSWWVMTAPILMALRWLGGRRGKIFKTARRACVVVFGVVGLATLLLSTSTTLTKALGALRGGGAVGFILGPFAMAMAYVFYVAPACLLPRAIARAWTNTLDDDAPIAETSEEDKNKTPEQIAKEKRKKRVNLIVGFVAVGATLATGSDLPLLILFAFQLLKVDPEDFVNAIINKGSPERMEMEQAIADKFAGVFADKKTEASKTDADDASADDARDPTTTTTTPAA